MAGIMDVVTEEGATIVWKSEKKEKRKAQKTPKTAHYSIYSQQMSSIFSLLNN